MRLPGRQLERRVEQLPDQPVGGARQVPVHRCVRHPGRGVRQDPGNAEASNGFKPFISGSQGTSFPLEAIWKGQVAGLNSEYHAGYYYANADTKDMLKNANGNYTASRQKPYRMYSSNS